MSDGKPFDEDSQVRARQGLRRARSVYLSFFLIAVLGQVVAALPLGLLEPGLSASLVAGCIFIAFLMAVAKPLLQYSLGTIAALSFVILFIPGMSIIVVMILDRKIYRAINRSQSLPSKTVLLSDAMRGPSFVVLLVDFLGFLALAVSTVVIIPQFRRVFEELNTNLPSLTGLLLSFPPMIYVVLSALLCGALAMKEFTTDNYRTRLCENILVGLCGFGWFLLLVAAFFLPMISEINRLGE